MVAKDIKESMKKGMISIKTLIERELITIPVIIIHSNSKPKHIRNTLQVTKSSTKSLDNTKRTLIMNMINKTNINSIRKILPTPTLNKIKESLILNIGIRTS
jgi:hypothetical protein